MILNKVVSTSLNEKTNKQFRTNLNKEITTNIKELTETTNLKSNEIKETILPGTGSYCNDKL
jgi:hypothetical protein